MNGICILSSSIRTGRNSQRVTLYLKSYLEREKQISSEILDLAAYDFPLFKERLRFLENPSSTVLEFAQKLKQASGIIIVTPEYNGGYPAALKNVIDLLYDEWKNKPIAIATVSTGAFGGSQVITSLQFTLWKMGARVISSYFPVPNAETEFDPGGIPMNPAIIDKRAAKFTGEFLWWIEAMKKMNQSD